MKKLYAMLTALIFALSSMAVTAQMGQAGDQTGGGSDSAFSAIDENNDGVIDSDEAENAGISDNEFEEMDTNGDGNVSQYEYRQHQSGGADSDTQSDDWE